MRRLLAILIAALPLLSQTTPAPPGNYGLTSGAGKIGLGVVGAGGGQYMSLPPGSLDSAQGTVSLWVNTSLPPSDISQPFVAVGALDDNGDQLLLWYWDGTQETVGWVVNGTDYRLQINSSGLTPNSWHYVTYTWNASMNSQIAYIDGVAVTPTNTPPTLPSTLPTMNVLYLGTSASNPSYSWDGTLDELRISNIQRSDSWIATDYATQSNFASVSSEMPNP